MGIHFGKENNSSRRVILKIELESNNLNSILSRSAVTPVFPEGSLGVVHTCRPHARAHHKHTHAYTKNPLGRIPCFFVETNNKYQKETDFTSETLSSFSTNIGAPLYDQVCIIIHPYQHRRKSGFLSFCRLNCILSFRDPIFFEHVHLEWTSSQVPLRVYYSSGVGLRLLVRLEKSLITKGPHRYV